MTELLPVMDPVLRDRALATLEEVYTQMSGRKEREYVADMYPGETWKERVANMSRDQVVAIYLRFIRDGQEPISKEIKAQYVAEAVKEDPQTKLF